MSDAWSRGILVSEATELYEARLAGRRPVLPELPVQYADYAVWQRKWLADGTLEAQLAWWRERLAGAPPLLAVPTDRPRPARPAPGGGFAALALPEGPARRIRALARREGATLFMTLLAAWQLLLSRYSGQEDVSVGTPVAGRGRVETEGLIGFFVNTLVLRVELGGDPTFAELVRRVREATLDALQHQEVPFERLVEELQPERSLTYTPLLQSVFALHADARGGPRLGGVEAEPAGRGPQAAKFDLETTLVDHGDLLGCDLVYRADLWDAASAERMLEHFRTLLDAAGAHPERRLAELPLLAPAERDRLVAMGAATERHPVADTLHGIFAARAARRPDAAAVSGPAGRMSYGELDRRSAALARYLASRGVGPGARVGVFCERSPELLVAILGTLRAGAAYVPLDPAHPRDRLAFVLADSGARLVLTQAGLADALPETGCEVLRLDADRDRVEAARGAAPAEARPEDAAYVIYTSGSTGRPKGVEVEHRQTVRLFRATDAWFGFGEDDAWTLFHSAAFDFSVWETWGALLHGGRLVVVPFLTSRDPRAFHALLREEGVTVLSQTPSAFRQLMHADRDAPALAALRQVVFGGEALDPAALAPWTERYGCDRPRLVNMYGITETTVHVTYRPIGREDVERGGRSPLGVPIPDLALHVLDRGGEPSPPGVPGEIHVGGAGLARGYLNRPELTAERFVPDPFSAEPGARLYRSGDLARRLPGGEPDYLGRADEQVKVRGFRIELGEIEAALARHPVVREAVVVARPDAAGGTGLVGYAAAEGVDARELREHLRAALPEYMVPGALVVLETLPLTVNGKVDRARLPEPEEAARTAREHAPPTTPVERALAAVWEEVLGAGPVGVGDTFLELGGHSLRATRVAARVREALGVEMPLRPLFEGATLGRIAAELEAAGARPESPGADAIPRAPRGEGLPLSFAQQRLWFLDQLQPGSTAYNLPAAFRVRGPLDAEALERALGEVVRRHEALRTTFSSAAGRAVQVVHPAGGFRLPVLDLRDREEAAREAELRLRVDAEEATPFDLAAGPLLRVLLVRLGEREHALLLAMHHIVSDGWSTDVMVREVAELYEAFREGRPSPLPELPVQYADFAAWQRDRLAGATLEGQLAWWRERLAGAPPALELPTDRPRPRLPGPEGGSRPLAVPPELADALRAFAQREGSTLFMALMAAWQALLGRHAGQTDVSVGMPIAGRTRVETEGLIGFFVNTLVIRTDLSGGPDGRALLRRVRETMLGAYQHQDLPFEKLVEELGVERSLGRTPLFQALLSLGEARGGVPRLAGAVLEPIRVAGSTAKFDLSLSLADDGGRLGGALGFRAELFDPATADRLLERFVVLLRGMAESPDTPVAELPLLAEWERERVLREWSAAGGGAAPRGCVHPLVEAHAALRPGAAALVCGAETLAYAELDARANRLARHLRRLGVGPEVPVAVFLEPSADAVVALLGILKAGGAFVPLDPAYQAERNGWMLEDSGAPVLVTRAALADGLPAAGRAVVRVDADRERIAAESAAAPGGGAVPGTLAYVIYTSGSTGRPKGVRVEHAGLASLLGGARDAFGLGPADAMPCLSSYAFDIWLFEALLPLVSGGTLRVVPRERVLDVEALVEELRRVTAFHAVPSLMAEVVRAVRASAPGTLPGIRAAFVGGEAVPPELVAGMGEVFPAAAIRVLYGPTEGTILASAWRVPGAPGGGRVHSPIGRPLAGARTYVLDGAMQPAPIGVPGELCIAGAGVARGYHRRPELTAERFVPCPFAGPGERMYRTGDLVRWGAEGELEYLGRLDHQVKVRGFRIEPGEIEAVLRAHPAVREAAVAAREDGPAGRRLVAYLVARTGAAVPAAAQLRAHLRERLPEHMVPAALVALERLPRTPTGKLDRAALPAPGERPEGDEYVAPSTPTEEAVAAVWAETLGIERVGAGDNFFDLGGHSLLLVQMHARLRERLGTGVSVARLFQFRTLAELARHLDESREPAAASREATLGRAGDRRSRTARQLALRARAGSRPPAGGGRDEPGDE